MTDLTYIIIPCFNEERRIDVSQIGELVAARNHLILVDDGSTDGTLAKLNSIASTFCTENESMITVLPLVSNVGKAEAVRQGLLLAVQEGAVIAGYLDADFATPSIEMLRMIQMFKQHPDKIVLLAARWAHLGASIERHRFRHYGGRLFATLASILLDMSVYDTQCGAKLFRVNTQLALALDSMFISKWAFDVELIGRLRHHFSEDVFLEIPLKVWVDVPGSKIGFLDMIQATAELIQIWLALRKRKRA